MRNCPNCGTEVRAGAAFCRECGTRLQPMDGMRRCPNCGTEVRAEAAFCRECGARLQPAGTELGRDSAAPRQVELPAEMRHANDLGKSERMEDIAAPSEAGELVLSSWVEEPTDSEEDRSPGPKKASARASRARHRRS